MHWKQFGFTKSTLVLQPTILLWIWIESGNSRGLGNSAICLWFEKRNPGSSLPAIIGSNITYKTSILLNIAAQRLSNVFTDIRHKQKCTAASGTLNLSVRRLTYMPTAKCCDAKMSKDQRSQKIWRVVPLLGLQLSVRQGGRKSLQSLWVAPGSFNSRTKKFTRKIYVCMHACMHVCMYVYLCICMYMYMYEYEYEYEYDIDIDIQIHIHIHIHIHIYIYIYICTLFIYI